MLMLFLLLLVLLLLMLLLVCCWCFVATVARVAGIAVAGDDAVVALSLVLLFLH